jgi:putative DNA primase/helicase
MTTPKNGLTVSTRATTKRAVPVVVSAADLAPMRVDWLWKGYIPRGAVTILDGDPGLGKSTLTMDLAARVSRGWVMPPAPGEATVRDPASVMVLTAEDDASRTIRPRLEAAGADLARVHFWEMTLDESPEPTILPDHLPQIEEEIDRTVAALVILDPLMAYFAGSVDTNKDADVRRVLCRFKEMAERTDAAVLVVRHLNKLVGGSALYRGGGSIGIIGAARSALLLGRHPDDSDVLVLAPVKCNWCQMPEALAFSHESVGETNRLAWAGEVALTADDVVTAPIEPRRGAIEKAEEFLLNKLSAGPVTHSQILSEAGAAGVSKRTLNRAKANLRIRSDKTDFGGGWAWSLPSKVGEECQGSP